MNRKIAGVSAVVFLAASLSMTALAASPVVVAGAAPGEAGAAQETQQESTAAHAELPALKYMGPGPALPQNDGISDAGATFDTSRFVLPDQASVLVVVEGTGGTTCKVYAYERMGEGWIPRVVTTGSLGKNGMSNNRTEGDKTTPIGLFQMNTPFGQGEKLEGFPSNYIQVDDSYVWEDDTNRLTQNLDKAGERVGSSGYSGYYDYVIDAGYNPNAVYKKGSALFLHCGGDLEEFTSGCVAITRDEMIKIMRLYGTYGDGRCYAAQAPANNFDMVYDAYGVNNGLSPDGTIR